MAERQYYKLEPSEIAILQSASQIFAAYVAAGSVSDESEQKFLNKSVDLSIKLSRKIENLIQSDDETGHGG